MGESAHNENVIKKIKQIGMIVGNLEHSVKAWEAIGIAPWNLHQVGEGFTTEHVENGLPRDEFKQKYGLCMLDDVQLELIEPRREGDGDYSDFLKLTGGGVHHLLVEQGPDFEKFISENGIKEIHSFRILRHGKKIAYYDTRELLGVILEVYVNEG